MKVNLPELLGQLWQPGPASWSWLNARADVGGFHVLILELPTGRTAVAFSPEDLAAFIRSGQEQLTGLTLPVVPGLVTP